MNIFFLSMCPILAAQYVCDMHCSKMFVELMQVLSTVFIHYTTVERGKKLELYRATHKKHPVVLWVMESSDNLAWCILLGKAMSDEYMFRYGKKVRHASHRILDIIIERQEEIVHLFPSSEFTNPPLCMPDKYKISKDAVESYRFYYRHAKASFAKWKNNTQMPEWWKEMKVDDQLIEEAEMEREKRLSHEAVKREEKKNNIKKQRAD